MSTYTVETIVRDYRAVWEAASSALPTGTWQRALALVAAAVLEDGTPVDRRPSGFGNVELG